MSQEVIPCSESAGMVFSSAMAPDDVRDGGSRAAELGKETKDLKLQLEERDELLLIVGHELRNPISPLFMQVAVMAAPAAAATNVIEKAGLLGALQAQRALEYDAGADRTLGMIEANACDAAFGGHPLVLVSAVPILFWQESERRSVQAILTRPFSPATLSADIVPLRTP